MAPTQTMPFLTGAIPLNVSLCAVSSGKSTIVREKKCVPSVRLISCEVYVQTVPVRSGSWRSLAPLVMIGTVVHDVLLW